MHRLKLTSNKIIPKLCICNCVSYHKVNNDCSLSVSAQLRFVFKLFQPHLPSSQYGIYVWGLFSRRLSWNSLKKAVINKKKNKVFNLILGISVFCYVLCGAKECER